VFFSPEFSLTGHNLRPNVGRSGFSWWIVGYVPR
jgi:hypothetical protein